MPIAETSERDSRPCPSGKQVITLKAIKTVEVAGNAEYGQDPNEKITKWVWEFESEKCHEDGTPGQLNIWTGTKYGNPKAALTIHYDMVVPGMNKELAKTFDSDTLIDQQFEAMILHQTSEKTGAIFAKAAYISPLASPVAAEPSKPAAKPSAATKPGKPSAEWSKAAGAAIDELVKQGWTRADAIALAQENCTPGDMAAITTFANHVSAGDFPPATAEEAEGFVNPFETAAAA